MKEMKLWWIYVIDSSSWLDMGKLNCTRSHLQEQVDVFYWRRWAESLNFRGWLSRPGPQAHNFRFIDGKLSHVIVQQFLDFVGLTLCRTPSAGESSHYFAQELK